MPQPSKTPGISTSITKPISLSSSSSITTPKAATQPGQPTKLAKPFQTSRSIRRSPRNSCTSRTSQTAQIAETENAERSFICTICWQSQHAPSKPKLLGTSSRIVCRACWKAVLDLSICWVCGECIVRGDEVVSLGWCFWHRACFGCLTCGIGIDLREFEGESGGGWGEWDVGVGARNVGTNGMGDAMNGRLGNRKRMIGVELERIPLCETCEIDTAGSPYADVVERGLETVSRFDGGLSRDRLDMLSEEKEEMKRVSRSRWRRSRFRGSSGLQRELKRFINGSTSRWSEFIAANDPEAQKALIKHAAEMGISEDGNGDEGHEHSDDEMIDLGQAEEEASSTVYVSVLDPIGEPAFKPSKTKPLPMWMLLLPNNVHREREAQQQATGSEPRINSHEIERLKGRTSRCSSENNKEDTPIPSPCESTSKVLSRTSNLPGAAPVEVSDGLQSSRKSRLTISIDPMRHAYGSLGHRGDQRPKATEPAAGTYATRPFRIHKTPYPTRRGPSITRSEATSYLSHGLPEKTIPELDEESCCALVVNLQTPDWSPDSPPEEAPSKSSSIGYITLPSEQPSPLVVHSSEYLERYQPKVPETQYRKYVAKEPEPIIDKIRRQRIERQSLGQAAEEAVEKRRNSDRSFKADTAEGLDPTTKEGLKKELRNLFFAE